MAAEPPVTAKAAAHSPRTYRGERLKMAVCFFRRPRNRAYTAKSTTTATVK